MSSKVTLATSVEQPGNSPETDTDTRPPFRVFLACSRELDEERQGFDAVVRRLQRNPAFARTFRPEPVRWETSASGADQTSANRAIALSVDFPTLDVVVVVVWQRVGQWTLEEYERALALFRRSGKPKLLVYVRDPGPGQETPADVAAFRERAFRDGVIASPYAAPHDFLDKMERDLAFKPPPPVDRRDIRRLRRQFAFWGGINFTLGLASTMLSMTMSFPTDGVTYPRVLAVLFAPIVLLLTTLGAVTAYRRVLSAFKRIWHSPNYTDNNVWVDFEDVIPAFVMPRRTISGSKRAVPLLARVLLTIGLATASGPIGAANAIFNEILIWEYVVGWAVTADSSGPAQSVYVDRGRKRWPFGLQDDRVRAFRAAHPDELIHVHAQDAFCDSSRDDLPVARRFRCNQGPEVKLPLYPWLFVIALGCETLAVAAIVVWLATFRQGLSLFDWEA